VSAVNLKVRCFHLVVAALFLWSLGASGICEARCLEAAFAVAAPAEHGAGSRHAEPQPSCHGSAPAEPTRHAESLDPSASGGEPSCHCLHTDEALLQPRADSGRPDLAFAAFALPARAVLPDAHPQWRPALSGSGVTLAPHQHRNPPLLI
jgi:hypothetical protein